MPVVNPIHQRFALSVAAVLLSLACGVSAENLHGYSLRVKLLDDGVSDTLYQNVIANWERRTGATVKVLSKKEHFELDREIQQDITRRTVDYCVGPSHTSFASQYTSLYRDLSGLIAPSHLAQLDAHVLALSKIDGELVQLPRFSDISEVFYNKAVFEAPAQRAAYKARFGRELTPPHTWSEFALQAKFFARPPKLYGTQFPGGGEPLTGRFYEMLIAEGGQLFDGNWHPTFNSAAGLRALNFFVDLHRSGAAYMTGPKATWAELAQAFASGSVALDLDWGAWARYFNDPKTSRIAGQVGIARAPKGTGGKRTGWSGSHSLAITKNCDNPAAAADFLIALTDKSAQLEEARQGKLVVRSDARTEVQNELRQRGETFLNDVLSVIAESMAQDAVTPPLTPEWLAVSDALWPQLRRAILGEITPAEALRLAEKDVQTVMLDAGRLR